MIFLSYFNVFKVNDDETASLSDIEGELNHIFNFTNNSYERVYSPKTNSLENCLKIIKAFESGEVEKILAVMKLV
jgi:hypothetical protein